MKRVITAVMILFLVLYFGASGEHRAADAAESLCRGAEELRGWCEQYDRKADGIRQKLSELETEWRDGARTLSLYMNSRELRPVTEALRDIKQAAADGSAEKLGAALRRLGWAVDDMKQSEKLSLANVF